MKTITLITALQRLAQCLLVGSLLAFAGNSQAVERVTYYHNDALGSPVAATGATGTLLWRESYAPYGKRLTKEAGSKHTVWYTGKPEEAAFGLSYFGARWYNPAIGRFMAMDPAGFDPDNIHSFGRYGYANDNPYRFIDPDGRDPYLVGRPLKIKSAGNIASHNFIVNDANYIGDPGATVYSYGMNESGNTGRVDARTQGFSKGTSYSDSEYWMLLGVDSKEEQEKSVSKIPASDATVKKFAESLKENTNYDFLGFPGTNSNSAASAVANRASGTNVPLPKTRPFSPGVQNWNKIQFK
jgi:RHS repeat-associated protein